MLTNSMSPQLCHTEECTGCSACAAACPKGCIALRPDHEGFLHPFVDETHCVACGRCSAACPILQPGAPARQPSAVLAVQNTSGSVRELSSSGGVFSLLAERVIAQGGVVFGAGFDAGLRVIHQGVTDTAGLALLRGSKYVQSEMGDVFQHVRRQLDAGRQVLFSGTPCQVAGLHGLLGRAHDNLLCVDFVCHGVPSPRVFARWKAALEKRHGSAIRSVSFRRKDRGWRAFSFAAVFANGSEYRGTVKEELYLLGFLSDLFLRPACHACRFKDLRGRSDLTLADYWGVSGRFPDLDDDRGTSLVLVNTPAGERALQACTAGIVFRVSDYEHAVASNPAITQSSRPHPSRSRFFERLDTWPLDRLLLRMVKLSFRRKVKLFITYAFGRASGRSASRGNA